MHIKLKALTVGGPLEKSALMGCLPSGRCFTVSAQLSPEQYRSIEKTMEAQRGKVTFPGSHSWLVPEPRSEPSLWDVRMHSLATFPHSLLTLE